MKFLALFAAASLAALPLAASARPMEHVLLISVDGMHALDLRNFLLDHPESALAKLAEHGVEYTQATSPVPADSFPGLLALTTGGTPSVTGVYFDVSYARDLSPNGSNCKNTGTGVTYDESMDAPDGKGIDPSRLPLDPKGCKPVYPHSYLRVNTVFEAVRESGGYTAWIDKHPVYEIVKGPSGAGIDDLYTPEIGENAEGARSGITSATAATERYDEMKVAALIREIDGSTHDGKNQAPVPTLFGVNLQAVNVAQKLYGYENAQGIPSRPLEEALIESDRLIGKIVSALQKRKLLESTLLVVAAKHGNGPIDPEKIRHVDEKELAETVESAVPGALAKITSDQGALIWLNRRSETQPVARALEAKKHPLGISEIFYGNSLSLLFPSDSRSPDIVLVPEPGVIYAKAGNRGKAEHGGFDRDNTHVALLLSNPSFQPKTVRVPVSTCQVAPTMLDSLGISPEKLLAVRQEGTPRLPGLNWENPR